MKKPTILFIQGGGEGAYTADMKLASFLQEVLNKTFDIIYPKMPNENDPNYETYKSKIDKELKKINSRLIFVGHSLGGCYLLKYLTEEKINNDIAGMFFISTPYWGKNGWQYEGFTLNNELASKRTTNIPIFFYHGTDDEVVPFSHLALYAGKFPKAEIRRIIGRGHQLNNDLSEVVQDIKSLHVCGN